MRGLHDLAALRAKQTFKDLPGQRGSLGVFFTGGRITVGDPVDVHVREYPEVPERIYDAWRGSSRGSQWDASWATRRYSS